MQTGNTLEERGLFIKIAEGNEAAFATVFHEYNSKLFSTVLSITKSEPEAEEIIQNVFLKLWLNRHMLDEIENPGGWLYKIASNAALSFLRTKAVHIKYDKLLQLQPSPVQDEIQSELEAKELNKYISQAIENLPPARREIFILSRHHGLNRMEIANHMGIAESTVKNQLGSALKFIRQFISQKQDVYLPILFFIFLKK